MDIRYEPLNRETLQDVACCPGGLEVEGKAFRGNLSETIAWRERMLEQGMEGFLAYDDVRPRGFIEWMPAETAPIPIDAPGAAAIMCYHWAGTGAEDPEHLARERDLIERVIEAARNRFAGLVTQGWDAPTHFPVSLLEELGFREVERHQYIALMWLPFEEGTPEPAMAPPSYVPKDHSSEGLLAIDAAFSARCPYSIDSETHLTEVVSSHPLAERIRLTTRRIDSREEALACAVPPYDWGWVFFNGKEIGLFEYPGDKLSEEIARRIEALG